MLSFPDLPPAPSQPSSGKSEPTVTETELPAISNPKLSSASTPPTSSSTPILLSVLLVLLTVGLYSPVRHHPFVNYDDGIYVTRNDHVKSGLHRQSIEWAMTSYDAANWHPLTWISHIVDYQLFQNNAGAHHEVNLLLHVLNVLLLFWVLYRATGYAGRSAMVAALFALHPLNVESVAWIAERKNLLSMLFFLLTLGAWGWYAQKPRTPRYLLVMLLFALGLMSKPQVVTLPFVLLLWDYWPLRRTPSLSSDRAISPARRFLSLVEEKIPLFALSAAGAILTVKAQRNGGGFNPDYTLFQRLENAAVSYARYIGKTLWPSDLALIYPHPGHALHAGQAGLALLLLAVISVFVVRTRDRGYLLVGWLWFLGTLVPMIGLVQVGRQAMADRYAYLPCIGLFIMLCWGVADFVADRQISPRWLVASSCVLLAALAWTSYQQIGYWSDDVTLWTHTIQVTTGNYVAENELADALNGLGQPEEAKQHFQRALAIHPGYPPALMFLAAQNQREGNLQEAMSQYQQVIVSTSSPSYRNQVLRSMAFANLGHTYRQLGQRTQARDCLKSAVELKSDRFEPWLDLGIVSQQLGDLKTAIHAYYQAAMLHPTDIGYLLLAQALKADGNPAEAKRAEQKAKDLTSDYPRAQEAAARMIAQ